MKIRREWAFPNKDTFSIKPIKDFVRKHIEASSTSVDPFARNKRWATYTNDIDPATEAEYHMCALDFMEMLIDRDIHADLVLNDAPYSPRQFSRCYATAGIKAGRTHTQNARFYKACRSQISKLAAPGCVVLSFGWNSTGMGAGWTREETLLVCHGAAHNDTICVCDRLGSGSNCNFSRPTSMAKIRQRLRLFLNV